MRLVRKLMTEEKNNDVNGVEGTKEKASGYVGK
jgi:hypothetical protein